MSWAQVRIITAQSCIGKVYTQIANLGVEVEEK
jgi:hypothetical protein